MRICKKCGKAVDEHHFYYYDPDKESYCSRECFQVVIDRLKEGQTRQRLYNIIRDIFNVSFPTSRMLAEIKRYKEQQGISYTQQALILNYVYNVKQKERPWESLYLIPQYKDEAAAYYQEIKVRTAEAEHAKERDDKMRAAARQVRPNYGQGRVNAIKPLKLEDIL